MADPGFPGRVGEELIRGEARCEWAFRGQKPQIEGGKPGGAGDAKAVEWDIPHQLLPVGMTQVFGDLAGHAGIPKGLGDLMGARVRRTLELTEDDPAVGDVADDSGLDAVDADKAEAAEDLFRGGLLYTTDDADE